MLVLMDNFLGKALLECTEKCTAEVVVRSVSLWRAHFTLADNYVLIKDNGLHYANALVNEPRQSFRFMHRFTVAYAP